MKFIVIEGLDGSGKSTQINLLQEYFNNNNLKFKYLHFPRTDSPIFGDLIARFLRGDLGEIKEVNPYLVGLIYAGDRENASRLINDWLKKDYYVLVDRYVNSNIAFQCAKYTDMDEKTKLRKWLLNLEYEYYNIPKPDLSLFLDVPFSFTKSKLKSARTGSDREYLLGAKDIHEESLDFQELVKKEYLKLITYESNFHNIKCTSDENLMLPPENIFKKIILTLTDNNIIS